MDALGRANLGVLFLISGISIATVAYGALNLFAIGSLRSQLMIAEIGMLKAVGMTAGQLRTLMLFEATVVWLAGTLIGVPAGAAVACLMFQGLLGRDEAPAHSVVEYVPTILSAGCVALPIASSTSSSAWSWPETGVVAWPCSSSTIIAAKRLER